MIQCYWASQKVNICHQNYYKEYTAVDTGEAAALSQMWPCGNQRQKLTFYQRSLKQNGVARSQHV